MTSSPKLKLTAAALMTVFAIIPAAAQKYRLPGQHTEQTQNLLANQVNVGRTLSVDHTIDYLNYAEEEEEPEGDIYDAGWNSDRVNCYAGLAVPDRVVITGLDNYCMPHPGYVTSPYGYRRRFRRMHKGVDLKLNVGDTIRAAFDGRVRLTKYEARGYGKYVVVRHTNDLETVYGHLSRFLVEPGTYVKAGTPIALGGNTGRSFGSHLHFETRFLGIALDPALFFNFEKQDIVADAYTFEKESKSKGGTSTLASSESMFYKVKSGDTLERIARRQGTTVDRLCKLNHLKRSSVLRLGQVIRCM